MSKKEQIREALLRHQEGVGATIAVESGRPVTEWKGESARVYVAGTPSPETLGLMNKPEYTVEGQDLENDKRWKQYRKLVVQVMRAIIEMVNSKVAEQFGFEDYKLVWNIHCGCSMCPCSPGFNVLKGTKRVRVDHGGNYCVWVTFKNPEVVAERKKAQAAYAMDRFDAAI